MLSCKRGEIWMTDLGQAFGSEQGGIRPCLVIQNDVGNKHSPTTIIVPITTKTKHMLPTHINIDCLEFPSTILCEQIKVIDKNRLVETICQVDNAVMGKVDKALKISIGINFGR